MHRNDQDEDRSRPCRQEVDKGAMREQGNVNLEAYSHPKISGLNHIIEFLALSQDRTDIEEQGLLGTRDRATGRRAYNVLL